MIDLHTHSNCSDGSLSPTELVRLGVTSGLAALALTDHDTVAGLDEALAACRSTGIRFLGGVEFEAAFSPGKLHILGIGLSDWHGEIEKRLIEMREKRTERNRRIIDKMQKAGIAATLADIEEIAVGTVVGRPHFAEFLVRNGIVRTIQEGFDRYLATGKRFYAKRENFQPAEVVALIRQAGGKAVLAHPLTLKVSLSRLAGLIDSFKTIGMEGIEAFHANAPLPVAEQIAAIARAAGMIVTAGSDYHGDYRPDRRLGRGAGGLPIGDEYLHPFLDGATVSEPPEQ